MNILTWDGLADIDSFHGERVMIIDDNEINLEVMQTIFNDFGLHTDAFVSGQKALESYQNSEPFFISVYIDRSESIRYGWL